MSHDADVLVLGAGVVGLACAHYLLCEGRSVRVLDAPPSVSRSSRKKPDDMAVIVEDLVTLLDGLGTELRRGRYPSNANARKVAAVLRKVADDLDA